MKKLRELQSGFGCVSVLAVMALMLGAALFWGVAGNEETRPASVVSR